MICICVVTQKKTNTVGNNIKRIALKILALGGSFLVMLPTKRCVQTSLRLALNTVT